MARWTAYNYTTLLAIKRILRPRLQPADPLWAGSRLKVLAPRLYDAGGLEDYLDSHRGGTRLPPHRTPTMPQCNATLW